MQGPANDQRRIWLLAGTGDGPRLARSLLNRGWAVTVSVVTPAATAAYKGLPLDAMRVGPLAGPSGIHEELLRMGPFRWVVDATHPFATRISQDLWDACQCHAQPMLRFDRRTEPLGTAALLASVEALASQGLSGHRLLLAVGGRYLSCWADAVRQAGAVPYARALPSTEGLRGALSAGLASDHLAVLRPLQGDPPGAIERALCCRWQISAVLCRQSGGVTEQLWHRLASELGLRLLLLKRPPLPDGVDPIEDEQMLLHRLEQD